MESDPENARLLMAVLPVMQAIAVSTGDLDRLEPHVRRLRELAPQRVQTQMILAAQALERGDYDEAIRVADVLDARFAGSGAATRLIRERARVGRERARSAERR
jgi:hypothetical protein